MNKYKQIERLLNNIDIEVSLESEDIESFDELRDFLEDNDYFNVEIVHYSSAIEYLSENDPSLQESLGLASEMGYDPKDLSSEVLASLLASQKVRDDFEELESEISELLN